MTDYAQRLRIPIEGNPFIELFTKNKLLICTGYNRIVIGARGPYLEVSSSQINLDRALIPEKERWRINSDQCFYLEYRTMDSAYIKIYHQKKLVDYADYLIGMYYISPFDLYTGDGIILIEPIKRNKV